MQEGKKGDKLSARWLGPYAIEGLRKGVSKASAGYVLKKGVNQSRLTLHHGPPPTTKPHSYPPSKKRKLSSTES